MSEESEVQLTLAGDRAPVVFQPRNSLVARGLRDLAEQAEQNKPLLERRRLAENGDADEQWDLGDRYYRGYGGVAQDYSEAEKWFRKAAEQSHLFALIELGAIYEQGKGLPADRTEAARHYFRAADIAIADCGENIWDPDAIEEAITKGAEYGHASAQTWIDELRHLREGSPWP